MAGEPLPTPPEREARARDAAIVLPLLGLMLLMPPVIVLFAVPIRVAGVPLIVVYLFGVWLALVLGAALLGRALQPRTPASPDGCSTPS
ncbi:MAG: hypothetical protein HS106_01900 [Ideonella sp.]|nr:MAG: hypothetical protein F9K36_03745 [Burkholderiaceae bacterium]MBE7424812.1 hypothetical protein [Ideonella sp.]